MTHPLKASKVHLHKQSKTLEITFFDCTYHLPAEFLRTHSPSAEVRGHGKGQERLIDGKIEVGMQHIQATGNYGIKITFDDGHESGIFTWAYLKELGEQQIPLWEQYLQKLKADNKQRDPYTTTIQLPPNT